MLKVFQKDCQVKIWIKITNFKNGNSKESKLEIINPIKLQICNLIGCILTLNFFGIGSFLFLSTKHFDKYVFIKMFCRIKDLKYSYNRGIKSNKKPPAAFCWWFLLLNSKLSYCLSYKLSTFFMSKLSSLCFKDILNYDKIH